MRHRIKGRKLNRTSSHRLATFRALATALIKHKKITTTVAKAKETRLFVEPLITRALQDSVHNRRLIAKHINDREVVTELFDVVAKKVGSRTGGYTRVVKLGRRLGDAAEMAIIELVDFGVDSDNKKKAVKKSSKAVKKEKVQDTDEKKADIKDAEIVEETVEETKTESVKEVKDADEVVAEDAVSDDNVASTEDVKADEKDPENEKKVDDKDNK